MTWRPCHLPSRSADDSARRHAITCFTTRGRIRIRQEASPHERGLAALAQNLERHGRMDLRPLATSAWMEQTGPILRFIQFSSGRRAAMRHRIEGAFLLKLAGHL